MSSAEVNASAQGQVTQSETLNYRTFKPVTQGLFCEHIFGKPLVEDERWLEAYQQRVAERPPNDELVDIHPQNTHMGLITFAHPLIHPWFLDQRSTYIIDHTHLDLLTFREIINLDKAVIVQSSIVDIVSREEAIQSDDGDQGLRVHWGAEGIRFLLQRSPGSTAMIMSHLCVLPPDFRPPHQVIGQKRNRYGLNELYGKVIHRNLRLSELMQAGAPQLIICNEIRMLQSALSILMDHQFADLSLRAEHQICSLQHTIDMVLATEEVEEVVKQLDRHLSGQVHELECPLPQRLFKLVRYVRAMGISLISG